MYIEEFNILKEFYREVYASRFTYSDKELDYRLERKLFDHKEVVIRYLQDGLNSGYYILQPAGIKKMNIYGEVIEGSCIADFPKAQPKALKRFTELNGVCIVQPTRTMYERICIYIDRIAKLFNGLDKEIIHSYMNTVIVGDKSEASKILKRIEQIQTTGTKNGIIVVPTKNKGIKEEITAFRIADKLDLSKHFEAVHGLHNKILETMGVNFTPYEKKERLVTDEVKTNNQMLSGVLENDLLVRQYYLDKLNTQRGHKLTVKIKEKESDSQCVTEEKN